MGRAAADVTADGKIELQRQSRETAGEIRRGCKGDADLLPPSRINAASSSRDGGPSWELGSWLAPRHAFGTLGVDSGFCVLRQHGFLQVLVKAGGHGGYALLGFLFPLMSNPSWEQRGFGFSCYFKTQNPRLSTSCDHTAAAVTW